MNPVWMILFAPLAAALLILVGARKSPALSAALSIGAVTFGFVQSLYLLFAFQKDPGVALSPVPVEWLVPGGDFVLKFGATVDRLSLLMLLLVTGVGSAIHIFALGYMKGDQGFSRFFGCLSLFVFSMLGIVLASSFIQMFIFWELVGLSSYLLIGHWFERPTAAEAAKKAFLVNRVSDFGFMLGILIVGFAVGTFEFADAQDRWATMGVSGCLATTAALLIFCGAVGKSAQFPLHVWLPDAMEGPTPVSALIHAATMVAAGVYMLARVVWLIAASASAAMVVAWVGAITATMAALIAVTQHDIKRVLAYSTLSQLGYMVMAVGLGGDVSAMFHLTTHAFFKALLFLGAGAVIVALHHEQDIWKMGGLFRKMPVTFVTFLVGTLALAGVWPLSGFYSKDQILILALEHDKVLFGLAAFTALLTAFYMGRLLLVAFLGKPRDEHYQHAREVGPVMFLPLVFLAILSVIGGWGGKIPHFISPELHDAHHNIVLTAGLLAIPAMGFVLAIALYANNRNGDSVLKGVFGPLYYVVANKFYFDEAYGWMVKHVQGTIAAVSEAMDRWVVQGVGIGGTAGAARAAGALVRRLQTGNIRVYAFGFAIGLSLILYLVLMR